MRDTSGTLGRHLATIALGTLAACHSGPVVVTSTPSAGPTPLTSSPPGAGAPSVAVNGWRFDAREHVDLWLHGFAMLQADSSLVPTFRLGYRDAVDEARRAAAVTTRLDSDRRVLQQRLREQPALGAAQFVALYFASWDDMQRGIERFLRANGNVRAAGDQETLRMYATLDTYFPTAADREWVRMFVEALADERVRFYRTWWSTQQSARASMRGALELSWRTTYASAFGRFLGGTNQRQGTVLLSLPLGGEGRTLDVGRRDNFVAVGFPNPEDDASTALFVMAHELVGTVSNAVVRDHTTPREQQSGESGRLSTLAAVRGGAIMLDRVAPDLAIGYRRYYLGIARQVPGSDVPRQFDTVFAMPDALRKALEQQIDLVLNGI
ncbi:MAG: hypothetical protein IT361_02070 [Gemmatimonadaceae bacterium]|nr:hypothetical protein [Gemmatimonadaceae bacterium]